MRIDVKYFTVLLLVGLKSLTPMGCFYFKVLEDRRIIGLGGRGTWFVVEEG